LNSADIVISALRTGHDRLAALVKTFDDESLAAPSAATEWDTAQVLSHLGSGAEVMTNTVQLALDGEPGAPGDFNRTVWARWDVLSRREQAAGFLVWNERLTTLFESLDEKQRDGLRVELPYLPVPADVATVGRMRLSELTHHSWDIRSISDPDATLDAEAVAEMLQTSGDLAWISRPAALDGQRAVLTVVTTEPVTQSTLHLTDPVSINADLADRADGTLHLPAEAWLRLTAGRLDADRTPDTVDLTGPISLDLLRKLFPGY
jgi:uncharacterized protein (TIGR03083 family)